MSKRLFCTANLIILQIVKFRRNPYVFFDLMGYHVWTFNLCKLKLSFHFQIFFNSLSSYWHIFSKQTVQSRFILASDRQIPLKQTMEVDSCLLIQVSLTKTKLIKLSDMQVLFTSRSSHNSLTIQSSIFV